MSEHPLDRLRHGLDHYEWARERALEDDALRAVEQLEQAAREVVEQDWRELVLDPTWSQRILEPALALFDLKEQTP